MSVIQAFIIRIHFNTFFWLFFLKKVAKTKINGGLSRTILDFIIIFRRYALILSILHAGRRFTLTNHTLNKIIRKCWHIFHRMFTLLTKNSSFLRLGFILYRYFFNLINFLCLIFPYIINQWRFSIFHDFINIIINFIELNSNRTRVKYWSFVLFIIVLKSNIRKLMLKSYALVHGLIALT